MFIFQFLRSLLFSLIFLPAFTLLVCLVIGIPFLFMERKKFLGILRFWVKGVTWMEKYLLGLNYEIRGKENLPSDGSFIVAAKHESTYETFKLHALVDDPAIILKKELLSIPLWGWYLKKSGVIAIDRSTPEKAAVSVRDGAKAVAEAGRPIVIFPQGTRVAFDALPSENPYKAGIYRVYEATGLPVVPMALNSGCFWPKGSILKKPGRVVFEFMPPMPPALDRSGFMAELERRLEAQSAKLAIEAGSEIKLLTS
jgi:1-acyl-sn-glycerol-3-phosphate acyltransferase